MGNLVPPPAVLKKSATARGRIQSVYPVDSQIISLELNSSHLVEILQNNEKRLCPLKNETAAKLLQTLTSLCFFDLSPNAGFPASLSLGFVTLTPGKSCS